MFIDNKYKSWYFKIIKSNKLRNPPFERHHIIPKSLGGDDSCSNLVSLSPREHFICHWLLTKFTFGNDKRKMQYALWNMTRCSIKHKRMTTSLQYQVARNSYISAVKSRECSLETRAKISAIHKGKTVSVDSVAKRKETLSKKGIKIQSTAVWDITLPDGRSVQVINLAQFCRENKLSQSGLSGLSSGKLTFYKGYTCRKLRTLGGLEIINTVE